MRRKSFALDADVSGTALDRPFGLALTVSRYLVIMRAVGQERVIGLEHTLALAQSLADRRNAQMPGTHSRVEQVTVGAPRPARRVDPLRNMQASWSAQ